MEGNKFEKTTLNTVRRRPDRGIYDKETIASIIREAKVVHVAFVDPQGLPQCIPMLGVWDEDETGQCYMYFHGYPTTRIMNDLSDPGTPIVATATLVDGLVLALSAFSHSMNYRSAVVHGVILPITSEEEKNIAFQKVVEGIAPGRWENSRQPNEEEQQGTGILRVKIETASAKVRTGPAKDSEKDVADKELVSKTWTGVIPLRTVPGVPEPSSYSVIPTPPHVSALAAAPHGV
ncbi:hypothetical protein RSOLAG1IB_00446 [Rhizoctonia solani AG-1 IB]|uniref:Pyridoxamine 5'-phosphate oxidase family protein n=1 Tax=Thanatephorus cucumeris (strain AG1-IB / isolate 7/3/14) TaxID=1108050 RepID=A0A0B7F4N0_THACB|nr:hypothetical protein RSOLAG1IB_00446 [Rhizoctonia solani AG-1 IB]